MVWNNLVSNICLFLIYVLGGEWSGRLRAGEERNKEDTDTKNVQEKSRTDAETGKGTTGRDDRTSDET